ncbi:MAG: hypothetical protein DMD83_24330 [Candidatus Rokuibacteriota bacterium]|nr:MAG: hypothetical protein DMD83_24330 [Candidatus Rokubacteria bacterium]
MADLKSNRSSGRSLHGLKTSLEKQGRPVPSWLTKQLCGGFAKCDAERSAVMGVSGRSDMGNDGGDRRQPCGGLFGCGDGGGRGYMMEPDAVEAAVTPRVRDGLDHMDELNHEVPKEIFARELRETMRVA